MKRIITGKDILFTSEVILKETAGVLMRPKFNVGEQIIRHFVQSIREIAIIVPLAGTVRNVCRDSDDDKILDKETSDKVAFITFIVPYFAETYKMNTQAVFFYLKKYGGWDYLNNCRWALHTDSAECAVRDIYGYRWRGLAA
jgi:hypothetical protein